MIVQCEKCQSTFNVNESLLKKEGSKVRCSLCKHVFTVYPSVEGTSEEKETLSGESLEFEEQVTEFGLGDGGFDFDDLFEDSSQEDIADTSDTKEEESLEESLKGLEEEAVEDMEDILITDLVEEEPVSMDTEDVEEPTAVPVEKESKDLSIEDIPMESQERDAKVEDVEVDLGEMFGESAGNHEAPWQMEAEDLEGFSDEEMDVGEESAVGVDGDALPDRVSIDSELESEPEAGAESTIIPAPEERRRPSRLPIVILLILLIFIGGAVVFQFLDPEKMPEFLSFLRPAETKGKAATSIRGLTFNPDTVKGTYVTSKEAGTLYVIRGIVKNNSEERHSHIFIRGSILDEKGQVLKRRSVYAGNTFDEVKIKNVSMADINKALRNRYGMGRKNVNVAKGASVPFMIVFDKLPQDMSEFTVELLSSSPGA